MVPSARKAYCDVATAEARCVCDVCLIACRVARAVLSLSRLHSTMDRARCLVTAKKVRAVLQWLITFAMFIITAVSYGILTKLVCTAREITFYDGSGEDIHNLMQLMFAYMHDRDHTLVQQENALIRNCSTSTIPHYAIAQSRCHTYDPDAYNPEPPPWCTSDSTTNACGVMAGALPLVVVYSVISQAFSLFVLLLTFRGVSFTTGATIRQQLFQLVLSLLPRAVVVVTANWLVTCNATIVPLPNNTEFWALIGKT